MSGHTPGPWFLEALTAESGNPAVLAGADTIGAPGYDSCVASVVGRLSDIQANARLIASAPDLAAENERLRAALKRCAWAMEAATERPTGDWYVAAYKEATEALDARPALRTAEKGGAK